MRAAAECARDLAREATVLVRSMQGNVNVRDKGGDEGPVTDADLAAEEIVVGGLRQRFPDDAILSEEAKQRIDLAAPRLWCVDPIDGTREFVNGVDEWAVMAGLLVDGLPAVGAIGMPDGTVFWGWVGGGVFCDDEPLTMPPHDSLDDAVVIHSHSRRESNREAVKRLRAGRTVQAGGAGYKAVQVLLGNAHIYIHARGGTKWWDSVAPAALVTAAGGHAGNAEGGPLRYDGGLVHQSGLLFTAPGLGQAAAARLA